MTPSQAPPQQQSGNGKYIVVAVLLLVGMVSLILWKVLQKPPEPVVVIPSASAGPQPLPSKFDDIPPPPPTDDAGPDTNKPQYHGPGVKPCEVTVCGGRVAEATEAGLAMLAKQTRKKCYEPALGQDPTLMGHVDIKLKIAGDGEICTSNVDVADPGLQQVGECTARLILAAGHVPAPQGCVNIKFPVNYKPMGK